AQLEEAPAARGLSVGGGAPTALIKDTLSSGGRLLLLDEPTASLDLKYQIEVASLIRRLHDERAVSIVLSTHDVRFARAVCTDVVLLRAGRILAEGPIGDVLTAERLSALYAID